MSLDVSACVDQATNHFGVSTPTYSHRSSMRVSRKASWPTSIPPPPWQKAQTSASREDSFDDVDINAQSSVSESSNNGQDDSNTLANIAALGLSFNADETPNRDLPEPERFSLDGIGPFDNGSLHLDLDRPFNKWMRNLQRRATQRRKTVSYDTGGPVFAREIFHSPSAQRQSNHKKSSSGSSFGFVTAVKSASISLASFSVAPRSRKTCVSSRQQRTDRSSKASNVGRLSEDSAYIARGLVIDEAVTNRSLQRRRVLEELINTEESYVADVKFLMNVYVTLLGSIPSISLSLRTSINRNLNEIVELHEELLGDLHRAVPYSEYTQGTCTESALPTSSYGHHRWKSLDAVPEYTKGSWFQNIPGMTAEPGVVAEVARVFAKKMNRFFIYEEYGAKYEMMIKDVASAYRTIPQWEVYQKGLEALASSLASINSQHDNSRKSLTIGDLLVKPIQRVCKYPLLFSELLKQTPVCDCPDSHMEIEKVLIRLREATTEINRATDDPRMKATMEKTWLLQDRLFFPDMPVAGSKNSIRALGHIHLCGVLYVSWQTRDNVDGQYLICLLYRDFLLLASASRTDQVYTVQVCIGLNELGIEEVDNGRGLQCHTAPFSWKLVFECDHHLFEITMSACSPKEELEWRSRLADRSCKETIDGGEQALLTSLSLLIKPMGTVFGKPGTIARRISIRRATTVGPISGLCQVIIKNTTAFKESASSASINRSQSLLTTNRIAVLAPSRAERIRLEALLADVWTREILPFPGMTGRARSEHLVRASASSMMRKLSVASIASNFTKRSGSMASLHKTAEDSGPVEHDQLRGASILLSSDTSQLLEIDEGAKSRLSVIEDGNVKQKDSSEILATLFASPTSSLASTTSRLATLKVKKSWAPDRQRMITPPLRTSSANSMNQIRAAPLSMFEDLATEDKENMPQIHTARTAHTILKQDKKGKGMGRSRAGVAEGIRNFFR